MAPLVYQLSKRYGVLTWREYKICLPTVHLGSKQLTLQTTYYLGGQGLLR
jgi:hypothetical protein